VLDPAKDCCPYCQSNIRDQLFRAWFEGAVATAKNDGIVGANPYGEEWPGGGIAFG
jgi:hypothetical protein